MAKTIYMKHECKVCRNFITGKTCPCVVNQHWECDDDNFIPPYPTFVSKQRCILPKGHECRMLRARWVTTQEERGGYS